jgi:tetratricopeptide (TPR) repeat protein
MFLTAIALFCGCIRTNAAPPGTPAAAAPASQPPPPWLPALDAEQQKLLAMPLQAPIEVPAPKVYPDLARFTFIGEGPINVPADLTAYADLVSQAMSQSPYLYVLRSGPESLANTVALYGPAPEPEPDLWKRAVPDASGQRTLQPALPPEAAREAIAAARDAQPSKALELLGAAAAGAEGCPGLHAMAADAALAAGDLAAAEAAAQQALQLDPVFPAAHRSLAEVYLRRSDKDRAREAIVKALALYPVSARAWQVAGAIVGRELVRDVSVPPPFIEVSPAGAVIAVSCGTPLCEHYTGCKAAFRFEPQLRQAVLKEGADVPYHLSATEEVVCLEAGLGAHLLVKQEPGAQPVPDPTAEMLIRLAHSRGLTSYAMFELIGRYRPEWLRVAPDPLHEAITSYVKTRVFGGPGDGAAPAAEGSVVTASVSHSQARGAR